MRFIKAGSAEDASDFTRKMLLAKKAHRDGDGHGIPNDNTNDLIITLWLFIIAMENGPFTDGLPIKNGDFPWLC